MAGGQHPVDRLRPPRQTVARVPDWRKTEVFQVDRFSRLPLSRCGQGSLFRGELE